MTEEVQKELAKIKSTFLGVSDHGILTGSLTVVYDASSMQSVGGYSLDPRNGAAAARWITGVLGACGVDSWEKVVGRTIYVLSTERRQSIGIAPLPTEQGTKFIFSTMFDEEN